jgi:hypothetical protein
MLVVRFVVGFGTGFTFLCTLYVLKRVRIGEKREVGRPETGLTPQL